MSNFFKNTLVLTVFVIGMVLVNVMLIPSRGTVDARNFEAVFADILTGKYHFIPDCLNYLCPSNLVLAKFPPGHFLLFYIFSFLVPVKFLGTLVATKILIFSFYVLTFAAVVWFARTIRPKKWSTMHIVVLFLSLISLILNTQGLAYTDVLVFPFFIISIASLLRGQYTSAGVFYAAACLMKWQPVMLLPLFIVYTLKDRENTLRNLLCYITGIGLVVALFYILNPNILGAIGLSLHSALGHHGTVALNITWIIQYLFPTTRYVFHPGDVYPNVSWIQASLFIIPYTFLLIRYFTYPTKQGERGAQFFIALLAGLATYYLFSFGVHENHFIWATVVALLLYISDPTRQNRMILLVVDAINFVNMFLFYGLTGQPLIPVVGGMMVVSVMAATVCSSILLLGYWHWVTGRFDKLFEPKREKFLTKFYSICSISFFLVFGIIFAFLVIEGVLWGASVLFPGRGAYGVQVTTGDAKRYRIVTLGESTTAGPSWPEELEKELNKRTGGDHFRVYNLGVPGSNTAKLLAHFFQEGVLLQPNMVITMMGINDQKYFALPVEKTHGLARLREVISASRTARLLTYVVQTWEGASYKPYVDRARLCRGDNSLGETTWKQSAGPLYESFLKAQYPERFNGQARDEQEDKKAQTLLNTFLADNPFSYQAYEVLLGHLSGRSKWTDVANVTKKGKTMIPYMRLCVRLNPSYNSIEKERKIREIDDIRMQMVSYAHIAQEISLKNIRNSTFYEDIRRVVGVEERKSNIDTAANYKALSTYLTNHGIMHVAMQYPLLPLDDLKTELGNPKGVVFVENEANFQQALKVHPYSDLFADAFAVVFGHATDLGTSVIANNVADVVMSVYENNQ